jgi:PEGA domain
MTMPRLLGITSTAGVIVFAALSASAQQPGGSVGTLPPGLRPGGGAGPTTVTRSAPPARPVARSQPHPRSPVSRLVAPFQTVAPFPNVAPLSGPLRSGLNPPLTGGTRDLFRVPPGQFAYGFQFYPAYAYGGYTTPPPDDQTQNQPLATGSVRLQATPGSAEVYVDGYYTGTVDDVEARRGLTLPAGPHTIELRSRGYDPVAVAIRVLPNDVVTYRATLDAQRPPAVNVPRNPEAASTIYVIPGCYMGNVPPRKDRVGAGCDVTQARIVTSRQGAESSRPVRAPNVR